MIEDITYVYICTFQYIKDKLGQCRVSKHLHFVDYLNIVLLPAECEKYIFSVPSLEHGTIFLTCKSAIEDYDSGI